MILSDSYRVRVKISPFHELGQYQLSVAMVCCQHTVDSDIKVDNIQPIFQTCDCD
jgi:hypothetical protein